MMKKFIKIERPDAEFDKMSPFHFRLSFPFFSFLKKGKDERKR